jgi:cytochrome c oxidase cbb3-type subunit 1
MHPYYVMRAAGGALYLAGAILMAFNITMTILGYQRDEEPIGGTVPALQPAQ